MSTHNIEGRREIEAIKQRLEAAKVQVSTASNNVASTKAMATKMIENAQHMSDMADKEVKDIENTLKKAKGKAKEMKDAFDNVKNMTQSNIDTMQSQLETSKKELNDVEKLLVEAEERAMQQENEGNSNKRRKISPQTISSGIAVKMEENNDYDKETDNEEDPADNNEGVTVKMEKDNDHAYDDETDKEDEDEIVNQTKSNVGNNPTANTASVTSSSNNINQVVVEGCGLSDVNGTYNKVPGVMYKDAPVYSKKVLHIRSIVSDEKTVEYVIYRNSMSFSPNNWFISGWKGLVTDVDSSPNNLSLYGSPQNADCLAPPVNGWKVTYGQHPPPKISTSSAPATDIQPTRSSMNHQANDIVRQTVGRRSASVRSEVLKDAEELLVSARAATSTAKTHLGYVDQISVEECGNAEINGIYIRSAHNGTAPVYTKRGVWKDKSVTFTLFWDRVKTWYIGLECLETKHWDRFTLFKSPVITILQGQDCSIIPPENGWKIVGRVRGGVLPAPKCRPIDNKIVSADHHTGLSNVVDQIVVRGLIIEPEVNGAYDRAANLVYRGSSVYIKPGQWDVSTSTGSPNHIIYRDVLSSIKSDWYIGRLYSEVTSANIGTSSTLYTSQHNSVTPPETGWDWIAWEPLRLTQSTLTPEQRKERQRSIALHMTLLSHASTCRLAKCNTANCAKMKGLLKHGARCKVKANGGCSVCKRIWALLQIHARQCKTENCAVPNCRAIRERYRQLELQQQAMDDVEK